MNDQLLSLNAVDAVERALCHALTDLVPTIRIARSSTFGDLVRRYRIDEDDLSECVLVAAKACNKDLKVPWWTLPDVPKDVTVEQMIQLLKSLPNARRTPN